MFQSLCGVASAARAEQSSEPLPPSVAQVTKGGSEGIRREQVAVRSKDITSGAFHALSEAEATSGWRLSGTSSSGALGDGFGDVAVLTSPGKAAAEEAGLITDVSDGYAALSSGLKSAERAMQIMDDIPKLSPFQASTVQQLSDGISRAQALQGRFRMAKATRRLDGEPLTRAVVRGICAESGELCEHLTELTQALQGAMRSRKGKDY